MGQEGRSEESEFYPEEMQSVENLMWELVGCAWGSAQVSHNWEVGDTAATRVVESKVDTSHAGVL